MLWCRQDCEYPFWYSRWSVNSRSSTVLIVDKSDLIGGLWFLVAVTVVCLVLAERNRRQNIRYSSIPEDDFPASISGNVMPRRILDKSSPKYDSLYVFDCLLRFTKGWSCIESCCVVDAMGNRRTTAAPVCTVVVKWPTILQRTICNWSDTSYYSCSWCARSLL